MAQLQQGMMTLSKILWNKMICEQNHANHVSQGYFEIFAFPFSLITLTQMSMWGFVVLIDKNNNNNRINIFIK